MSIDMTNEYWKDAFMKIRLMLAAAAVMVSALPAMACSLAQSPDACQRERHCAEQPWYLTPFCYMGGAHQDQTPGNHQTSDNHSARR